MNSGARDKVNEWVKKDYNSEDDFSGNAREQALHVNIVPIYMYI